MDTPNKTVVKASTDPRNRIVELVKDGEQWVITKVDIGVEAIVKTEAIAEKYFNHMVECSHETAVHFTDWLKSELGIEKEEDYKAE